MIDYDKALLSPASVFEHPKDVLKEKSLTLRQKKEILYRWEHDAKLLQTAADENMTGGERANLGQVQQALRDAEEMDEDPERSIVIDELPARISRWTERPYAFWIGLAIVIAWAVTGPIFHYSQTWQFTLTAVTTVLTFLMVFLIQIAHGRQWAMIEGKLDALVRQRQPS